MHVWTMADDALTSVVIPLDRGWKESLRTALRAGGAREAVGYLLFHGGPEIDRAAAPLTPELAGAIGRCVRYLPEQNGIIREATVFLADKLPGTLQAVLCETAFFLDLPPESYAYAIPQVLLKEGVRRYGGYGLCHRWVWEQAHTRYPDAERVVSLYLGAQSNLAAIRAGKPVETSIGFTAVEGLPSLHACGDIDPSIVGQLHAAGISPARIHRILSRESGLTGLLGRECALADILRGDNGAEVSALRRFFVYNIAKQIGAAVAALEGIDVLACVTDVADMPGGFTAELFAAAEAVAPGIRQLDLFYDPPRRLIQQLEGLVSGGKRGGNEKC